MRTVPYTVIAAAFVQLIIAGCAEGDRANDPSAAATQAPEADTVEEAVKKGVAAFVPRADQFGIERFRIVYDLEGQETGKRTMWVDDYGARVAVEDDLAPNAFRKDSVYYWDGEQSHMKDLPDGELYRTPVRTKASEPTAFATMPASDLELAGYERLGDKTIAGETCEHWKNDQFNYEGCRWNGIELEFLNGAGTAKIIQRTTATEIIEGEGIPERITALAQDR